MESIIKIILEEPHKVTFSELEWIAFVKHSLKVKVSSAH